MWNSTRVEAFRTNHFGALRLALASLVVVAHSYVAANGSNRGEPLYEFTQKHIDLGALAVDGFFIASGFMVAESLATTRRLGSFVWKRLRRLYPAFVLLWLLQSFVLAPVFSSGTFSGYSLKQWGILLFNLATLSSYGYPYGGLLSVFPENPLPGEMNVSLWTLRYEFGCYIGLACLRPLGLFRRRWLVTLLFAASWLAYAAGFQVSWNRFLTALLADGAHWPRFATFFLAGVTFWHWRAEIPRRADLLALSVAFLAFCLWRPGLLPVLLPFGWTYLLLWLAYLPAPTFATIGTRVDISYGTYLYAFPIQQIIVASFPGAHPGFILLLAFPATLLAGLCSWHLVEKHFLMATRPPGQAG